MQGFEEYWKKIKDNEIDCSAMYTFYDIKKHCLFFYNLGWEEALDEVNPNRKKCLAKLATTDILIKVLKELENINYGCTLESIDNIPVCGCCEGDDIRTQIALQIYNIKEMLREELSVSWLDRPENKILREIAKMQRKGNT